MPSQLSPYHHNSFMATDPLGNQETKVSKKILCFCPNLSTLLFLEYQQHVTVHGYA